MLFAKKSDTNAAEMILKESEYTLSFFMDPGG